MPKKSGQDQIKQDKEKWELEEKVNKVKNEIFEVAKQKFPMFLEEKVNEVAKVLEESSAKDSKDEDCGLSATQILPIIAQKCVPFAFPNGGYSVDELYIALNYYMKMIAEINKKIKFIPTKKNFCLFMGMSSNTYNGYLKDPIKNEVMQIIDDYITDINMSSAQKGELNEKTTIASMKMIHNLVEAKTPTVVEHKAVIDYDDIKDKIRQLQGRKTKNAKYEEISK